MQLYSKGRAAKWLREHVSFQDKSIKLNKQFVNRLIEECRLLPAHKGLLGPKFELAQLEKYADEVRPR